MVKKKLPYNYAGELKEVLLAREAGRLTPEMDGRLAEMFCGIARWVVLKGQRDGKVPAKFATDPDFMSDVLAGIIAGANKADLAREPKEIIVYLYRCGVTTGNDIMKRSRRPKHAHEEERAPFANLVTDFYGFNRWTEDHDGDRTKANYEQ